jgi:hypothetical protein
MLIGTPVDDKNIDLAKLLLGLRQDLDIYWLIGINLASINQCGIGKDLWGHLQWLAFDSICLSICKIYEKEKQNGYELNSIDGIIRHLSAGTPPALDAAKLNSFIQKHGGPTEVTSPISSLQLTTVGFRDKYHDELRRFKEHRDKKAAHSEYGFNSEALPSYDVMEKLFFFGADFYDLVSAVFVGVGPFNLKTARAVKFALKSIFQELGVQGIKDDIQ